MEPAQPELEQPVADSSADMGAGTGDVHPPNGHDELPPQQTSARAEQDQDESHTAAGPLLQTQKEEDKEQAPAPAPTLDPVNMPAATDVPGFFEHVPDSWMHQFIKGLPRDSLLVLFRCSRWLAACVLQTRRMILRLVSEQELTAQQTQARRSTITSLVSMRKLIIGVHIWPAAWQPFPPDLADRVCLLYIDKGSSSITSCCQWATLKYLRVLRISGATLHEEDAVTLCEAVEGRQLRQLRTLKIPDMPDIPSIDRLARALGPQLKTLDTRCEAWVKQVSQLTALQHLGMRHCTLNEGMMQQLCEHPTLKWLTLDCCGVQGDHSLRSSQWACVMLKNMQVQDLLRMPQGAQYRITGSIRCWDHSNLQGMGRALEQYLPRVVCLPEEGGGSFEMQGPCEAMAALLKHMQDVVRLILWCAREHNLGLADFWRALPASVHFLAIVRPMPSTVAQLWTGLPQHVQIVKMQCLVVPAAVLCEFVRTAPAHICEMTVCLENYIEYTAEVVASLHAVAPKHLKLEVIGAE